MTSLLVPARDMPALARAMIELAADPTRRERMSQAARDHIQRNFTVQRMTDDYLALFAESR